MSAEDHERLADELEREADKLARENERLERKIEGVRTEWHAKQEDDAVPGATKPMPPSDPSDQRGSARSRFQ